jgi:hypothetical protein
MKTEMKKFVVKTGVCILLVLSVIISRMNAQTFTSAVSYMKYIGQEEQKIEVDLWDYTSSAAHGHSARIFDNKRTELLRTIQVAQEKIGNMPPYEGDVAYRDSMVSFLNLYYIVLNEDYEKIMDMEQISEQSYDAMEAYLTASEIADKKLEDAAIKLTNQTQLFADKHGITLIEDHDKLSKKLEKASEALNYYNKIYLVFFKAYKQEIYLLDALGKNDINAIEQNRSSLLSFADEGLAKLTEIKHFKGDNSINLACNKMLLFYKDEVTVQLPIMIDFMIKKEEYDKIVSIFNAKDKNHLTQQEVDEYNLAIDNYNKSVNKYNITNQTLNNKRNSCLNSWNSSVTSFMERNVPKK